MELGKITMYDVCLLHSRAERALKSIVSKQLEHWGVTRMEWLLLEAANEKPKQRSGHTMGEIAEKLDVRLSQVTALVTSLSQSKLIKQKASARDKRTRFVQATTKGRSLLTKIADDMQGAMQLWLKDIPEDRLDLYMETVNRLGGDSSIIEPAN